MAKLTISKETDEKYDLAYVLADILAAATGVEQVAATATSGQYPQAVTLSGPPEKLAQVFRYFYTSAEQVIGAAENLEYRKYRQMIKDAAQGIRDEIAAGDIADDEALTERIESSGEVIYYSEAALTLRHSNNTDAYDQQIGEEGAYDCVKASFAQAADIREELGDRDELLDALSPLTDDEKEEARDAYRDALADFDPTPGRRDPYGQLREEIAQGIRHTEAGQEKVIAFLSDAPNR